MSLTSWSAFALLALLHSATPGPSVAILLSTALGGGHGTALKLVPGFAFGELLLIAASVSILTVFATILPNALLAMHLVGGAYLIFLGFKTIVRVKPILVGVTGIRTTRANGTFIQGFLTTGLNPKGLLFYVMLLPAFVDGGNAPTSYAILAATMIFVSISIDLAYIFICRVASEYINDKYVINLCMISGLFLIFLGIYLIFSFEESIIS